MPPTTTAATREDIRRAIDWGAIERHQGRIARINLARGEGRPLTVSDWRYIWRQARECGQSRDKAYSDLLTVYLHHGEDNEYGVAHGLTSLRAGSLTFGCVVALFGEEWSER
jgi:hypothetical protein